MINADKIELIMAKLTATADFANEVKDFMQELLAEQEAKDKKAIDDLPITPAQDEAKIKKEVAAKAKKAEEPVAEKPAAEEEEATVADIIEEFGLSEYEEDELKDELKAVGIRFGRAGKDELVEMVAQAIMDGKISTEEEEEEEESTQEAEAPAEKVEEPVVDETPVEASDDDELTEEDINEMSEEEIKTICEENEIEIPAEVLSIKIKSKRLKALREMMIELLTEEDEEEESVPAKEEDEFPASAERLEAEEAVEKEVREKLAKKKLTVAAIKKELKKYYEGDAKCADCKGCSNEEIIECYILLQKKFVDDEGEVHEASDPYERNEKVFCCGKECVNDPDNKGTVVCELCGEAYEID